MSLRTAAATLVLGVLAAASPVAAEMLGDDLCAFAIEGLTLDSTKAEVAAVFSKRGWSDVSAADSMKSNGLRVERIEFDRTRKSDAPEEIKADKDGPIGRFQLIREESGARSIRLSDYASEPPAGRARALCAAAAGRFDVSGCDERLLSRDQFGVIIRPKGVAAGEQYCTVTFDGQKTFYGDVYTLGVALRAHARRGLPGRKRGRE